MPETFGKTSKGASSFGTGENYIYTCKYTSGSAGFIESITTFIRKTSGEGKIKCAIYDSSWNLLANGYTEEKDIDYNTNAWLTFNFAIAPRVAAATEYNLAWWANTSTTSYYSAGSADQVQYQQLPYGTWPDPLSPTPYAIADRAVSIYATYVADQAPTAPPGLLCEGESQPTRVTDLTPEFSAVYNDPNIGDQANAVQIQVGSSSGGNDLWDSEWMEDFTFQGNRCSDKTYAGIPLSSYNRTYYWRIRFRDNNGAEGAWSANAQFTTYQSLAPIAPTDFAIQYAPLCFVARYNHPGSALSSACKIHVSSTLESLDMPEAWDSGWLIDNTVEGDLCTFKLYAGNPLEFGKKYYWIIRFKDENKNVGVWSNPPRWFIFRKKSGS